MSQTEISGAVANETQSLNKKLILLILDVFHFEISGKNVTSLHLLKALLISVIFEVSQFEISGIFFIFKQL